jgi:hypothetical protein
MGEDEKQVSPVGQGRQSGAGRLEGASAGGAGLALV